jgi:hypothetical protein
VQWNSEFAANGDYTLIGNFIQTSDGGYAVIGSTSFNGVTDTSKLHYWLTKTDSYGNVDWSRQYGNGTATVEGTPDSEGKSILCTGDGGFLVAGTVDYSHLDNVAETFLIKTNNTGDMEWSRTFDGAEVSPVIQTSDGEFVYAGSKGIVKTDSNGNLQWTKSVMFTDIVGRPFSLDISSLIETSDGALAGIGVATTAEPWEANIYLAKTQAFLPLPTPSPTPLITPVNYTPVSISVAVGVIAIISIEALAVVYARKNKKKQG